MRISVPSASAFQWTSVGDRILSSRPRLQGGILLTKDHVHAAIAHFPFGVGVFELRALPPISLIPARDVLSRAGYKTSCIVAAGHSNELAPFGLYGIVYRCGDYDLMTFFLKVGLPPDDEALAGIMTARLEGQIVLHTGQQWGKRDLYHA